MARGNKGFFHGSPLQFLQDHVPAYLGTLPQKKEDFWADFFLAWDEKYPQLNSNELEELEAEETSYAARLQEVKDYNKQEKQRKGRRKAILRPFPLPGEQLNELRARGAARSKLKSWFSNSKTKEKSRDLKPFRSWLSCLTAIHGAPRRVKLPWVLWQHPTHGEALRVRYRQQYKKDADEEVGEGGDGFEKDSESDEEEEVEAEEDTPGVKMMNRKYELGRAYYEELDEAQQTEILDQREKNFQERRAAYERTLKGETTSTPDELAERQRNAESVSQRALDTLCAQMECKGILILGEIVESEGDGEIFMSMVYHGALPRHEGIDLPKWAPTRSKAMMQTFADFLVACKKDEQGALGSLQDQGPPHAVAAAALCAHCANSLAPMPRLSSAPRPAALLPVTNTPAPAPAAVPTVEQPGAGKEQGRSTQEKAGKKARRVRNKGKGLRGKGSDEPEAEESNTSEDEGEPWGSDQGGSDADNEEEGCAPTTSTPLLLPQLTRAPNTPLREKLAAMPTPLRHRRVHEINWLSDYEFMREKNIARNEALIRSILPQPLSVALGLKKKPGPSDPDAPQPPRRASSRLAGACPHAITDDGGARVACNGADGARDATDNSPRSDSASGAAPDDAPVDDAPFNDAPTERDMPPYAPPQELDQPADDAAATTDTPTNAQTEHAPLAGSIVRPSVPPVAVLSSSPSPSPSPSPSRSASPPATATPSAKHKMVLELFTTETAASAWTAVVKAWWALETATGFQTAGKALSSRARPPAVAWWVQRGRKDGRIPLDLDDDGKQDDREDFYDAMVKWWVDINPAWRKGDKYTATRFQEHRLKQDSEPELDALLPGLNGLTSVLACLWWWHRLAGVVEGTPAWQKLTADLTWVLTEKQRALNLKRSASTSCEEHGAKRARLE
ncbi:hypothetical protein MSAN_01189300 [Mycena sanguinolenta]|uniref:Uncharacterized protein n=1 Tax=Mycena sanguinolenta TaxID=230812 RepID=A0A8H7D6V3_9AGAR|nr:hypothetical protein MSAN_01189300 [Mycena sanguinolenta]